MGTYLSTPVVDKCEEEGECSTLAWGVVDMQGWRKSMEDAHVARTDVPVPSYLSEDHNNAKVFGVFDGHGGAEVARFVSIYLVDVLTKQPTWAYQTESEDPLSSPVGQALVDAFHALDRMIDQPERRDELIRLRTAKPEPGLQKTTDHIPIPEWKVHKETVKEPENVEMKEMPKEERESASPERKVKQEADLEGSSPRKETAEMEARESPALNDEKATELEAEDEPEAPESDTLADKTEKPAAPAMDDTAASNEETDEAGDEEEATEEAAEPEAQEDKDETEGVEDSEVKESTELDVTVKPTERETEESPKTETSDLKDEGESSNEAPGTIETEGDSTDEDSDVAIGKEEAAKLDQDLMLEDSDSDEDIASADGNNRKVTVMFQKLLSLGANAGQMTLKIADKDTTAQSETTNVAVAPVPVAFIPTIVQNGRQICNLPDHPIHAGCTAIVAVLIGNKLTVANAGDSRGVLCRAGGRTEALSFDHKPSQDRELHRITNAGGFVNQFGRVNGNLNLSRSIGDLKYKQVPGIHPAGQMITAEPDIVEVFVQSNDEFLILGCDGIWDCLTNTQAVNYVRDRIDTMTPTQIGVNMLDDIISNDPRATQGIGGDNMTIMIIDLQPETRSYRHK